LISDGMDGELRADAEGRLGKHLSGCPECRAFARDLESIAGGVRNLPGIEPSARVWQKIVSGIRLPVIEEAAPAPRAVRWRFALAAASALAVIGAGLVIGLQHRRAAGLPDRGSAAFTMAKLKEAQSYYEKAIGALNEAAQSGETVLAPGLAEVFERNLAGLDRTIQVCRQMVDRSPDDPVIRAYLLSAYREKVSLFEEIMSLGRPSGDKIKTTTL
jgi:anti-sigma factor RsiW